MLCYLFAIPAAMVFAQTGDLIPSQLKDAAQSVSEVFTGEFARILVGIFFAGSCIAYAYNKDNEKMKAKVLAVMIGSGLLALSQTVVDKVFTIAGN